MTCTATRADGQPCRAMSNLVDGLCQAHHPGRAAEARARRAAGGHASALRTLESVPASELPGALETIDDCKRWLPWIATAVLTGRIHPLRAAQANTAVRAVLNQLESEASMGKRIKALERITASKAK